MSERLSDDYVARLESLASRFYPGQYVVIDESVDDLIGKSGVRPAWSSVTCRAFALT